MSFPNIVHRGAGVDSIVGEGVASTNAATGIAATAMGGESNTASGDDSFATGILCTASDLGAHAEGVLAEASGLAAHAQNGFAIASGTDSNAENESPTASGDASHSEGVLTVASGYGAHAEGIDTSAIGDFSHTDGDSAIAPRAFQRSSGNGLLGLGRAQYDRFVLARNVVATTAPLFNGDGTELSLESGRAYLVSIRAVANRSTGAERAGFVREVLIHAEGGIAVIDAVLATIDALTNPIGWALTQTVTGASLVFSLNFTVPAGVTARCVAFLQMAEVQRT